MRIDLGDGDWAELRHPNKIPRQQTLNYRQVFYRVAQHAVGVDDSLSPTAAGAAMVQAGGLQAMEDLADALVLAVVKDWSFGEVTQEVLLETPTADLKKITDRCTDEYIRMLQPDFGVTPDRDSPTSPSVL